MSPTVQVIASNTVFVDVTTDQVEVLVKCSHLPLTYSPHTCTVSDPHTHPYPSIMTELQQSSRTLRGSWKIIEVESIIR